MYKFKLQIQEIDFAGSLHIQKCLNDLKLLLSWGGKNLNNLQYYVLFLLKERDAAFSMFTCTLILNLAFSSWVM